MNKNQRSSLSPGKRKQIDPLEKAIEAALSPGSFISYNDTKCRTCIWGCRMPVEMIIDHWNPSRKRHRFETFCYGPKSCSFYRAGPTRKVPGRKGMSYTEEDWVDEDATAHRGPDD